MHEEGTTPDAAPQGPLGAAGFGVLDGGALGPLWLAWVGEGLTALRFGANPPPEPELLRLMPEVWPVEEAPIPSSVNGTLRRYLAGEVVDPVTIPVRLTGTRFQNRVWTALRDVRRGAVRSYGGLAADAGSPRAMRAVGMAMAANPIAIVVPCHRIVGSGFALGGYSGGLERKRLLLALEGVKVDGERVLPGQLDLL